MYDFCFTPVYAVVLVLAGLLGYLLQGSLISLVASGASAAVLSALTYLSFVWHKRRHRKCTPAVVGQLAVSLMLTGMMGKKFVSDPAGKIPQGLVGLCSALMVVYFIWNLVAIPTVAVVHRKKPKSKTAAAGEGAADAGKAGTGAEGEGVDAKAE